MSDSTESRERELKQDCRILEAEIAAAKRYTDGVQLIENLAKKIERDTRERCAQRLEKRAGEFRQRLINKEWVPSVVTDLETMADALRKGCN